jgi:hypothetical protein
MAGQCNTYSNTASDSNGDTSNPVVVVTACNSKTGALTMGFWQNNNGQALIAGLASSGACPLASVIQGYAEFNNLSTSAVCGAVGNTSNSTVVGYVYNVIKQANSSGSGAPMLRGQMLATLLTSYFSSHGGTGQGTIANLGNVWILLNPIIGSEDVRPAFINYNTSAPHL